MLDILSPLVHTWNSGDLKPDLWVVADSEVKGVLKAKFSWFSLGSDSVLETADTGMADKIILSHAWAGRVQESLAAVCSPVKQKSMLVYFNRLCCEGSGTALWAVISAATMK